MTVLACTKVNTVVDTPKPDLRDIQVTVQLPSGSFDPSLFETVSYYTDASDKGTERLSKERTFTAAVSKEATVITVLTGDHGESYSVSATQKKTYLSSSKELSEGMCFSSEPTKIGANDAKVTLKAMTSALDINIFDSKHFALDEKILSVSFIPEGSAASSTTVNWVSNDPGLCLKVGAKENAAKVGMVFKAADAKVKGKFKVLTDRKDDSRNASTTYIFSVDNVEFASGKVTTVSLDMSAPDNQPTRRVGVLGDSISTFLGWIDSSYSAYYPGNDATSAGGTGTVQQVEKTYWWKIINEKMSHGVLDVNNSYSGTKVVTENGVKGFVDRAYRFNDPDIIIIHGGTNDKNKTSPLGEFDYDLPIGQLNETCYRSAYIKLVKMLQNRYEGVQLIILVGDMLTTPYATANIEIAKHFGLPYVDFTKGGTITNDTVNIPKSTGSHPDAKGMQYITDRIWETCKDYLP